MNTIRVRVKELATELAVNIKDLIQALREMGIEIRSQMSSVSNIEAEHLRARFQSGVTAVKVDRQAIQPGQIVRRRRCSATGTAENVPMSTLADLTAIKPAQVLGELQPASQSIELELQAPQSHTLTCPNELIPPVIRSLIQAEAASTEVILAEVDALGETSNDPDTPKKRKKKKEVIISPPARIISMPGPAVVRSAAIRPSYDSTRHPGRRSSVIHPNSLDRSTLLLPQGENRERIRDINPFMESTEIVRKRRASSTTSGATASKSHRTVDFTSLISEEKECRHISLEVKKHKVGNRFGRHESENEYDIGASQPIKVTKRKIRIEDSIRVADLAHQMGIKAQIIIKMLFSLNMLATINHSLDIDTATLVAAEFGYEIEKSGFSEVEALASAELDAPQFLKPRPPVVTIMGHVDHGKTSLLDAIRKTKVALGEAGGITQHIGAYHVMTRRGEVVFLDTPGHEAFTAMRARGAQVTDIVVLVVAADDGVMEQTSEAVNHSRAAGVPIVVAVNKIDKENADPDRVKRELANLGLLPEEWGGDTIFAHVSAKKSIGLEELLEMILLQAEILDLKANPDKPARGRVVEARLDKGRGSIATLLIQEGTLHQGDNIVCGLFSGRVRALFNDQGKKVKTAGPAIPVEIQGLNGVPEAGDDFSAVKDEKLARRITNIRQAKERERILAKKSKITLETFLKSHPDKAETKNLNLVLKADVQGSLEAASDSLIKLSTDEIKVKIIHASAGAISESDVMLASASEAIIIGFNVRPTLKAREVAEAEGVEIRFYNIIYQLVDDIKSAMSGMLTPTLSEVYLGQTKVCQTFNVSKVGTIAGCHVTVGKIIHTAKIRLLRDGIVIYTGRISSLKRFKEDTKEVLKGFECGIGLEKFNDVKVGDILEAFEHVEEVRTLY